MSTATPIEIATQHAALVHQLGGEACVVPVPAALPHAALEVGRLGPLPCWSVVARRPAAAAVARHAARHSRFGLLMAHDPAHGTLSLAATIAPARLVTLADPAVEALVMRRVARWRPGGDGVLAAAARLAEALDTDAAGRRAFAELHRALASTVAQLPTAIPRDVRHAWTLLQLTRLLFLRFVESEGWLDGRPTFLRDALDDTARRAADPARHLLHPLFFGTLNTPAGRRSRLARAFGAIPFLNGGLFEAHPIERAHRWTLDRAGWLALAEPVVDRIEVTLDHDASDGRVTPELLGRVFEGVMDPDARRDAGAFYTPPALVRVVVAEALAAHLAPRTGRTTTRLLADLADPDPDLQRALLSLSVLDPAVGSGAFLVGTLALLHGPGARDPRRVRLLVTRRLHGTDRHPGAVRVTELRLWLEVLRAVRGRAPTALAPLPNLDAAIRAGDSLLDPLHGHPLAPRTLRALASERRAVTAAHGSAKRAALRTLQRAEHRALGEGLAVREAALEAAIRDAVAGGSAPTLFGRDLPPPRAARAAVRMLRAERRAVRAERRALARGSAAPAFALEVAYGPVLARGGFDLVVGNPPWVRAERLAAPVRAALAGRYRWWRGSGAGFRHLPDLAVAFLERAHELLAPGGTMAQLVPAKFLTAGYAEVARGALAAQATMHCVADLTDDPRADFGATTYPLALIASRRAPAPGHRVRCGLDPRAPVVPQAAWASARQWSLADPVVQRAAGRLAAAWPALGSTFPPHLGVKTGANAAFLDPPDALAAWCRPALRGRDLGAGAGRPRARLLWPADARGVPWAELPPPVARHLDRHRSRLEGRADRSDGPWWRLFRTEAATAPHRVVWADLARALRPVGALPPAVVPLNSCYVIAAPTAAAALALAAWLATPWCTALAAVAAEPAAGAHRRFGARTVGALPWPGLAAVLAWHGRGADPAAAADLLGLDSEEREALNAVAADRG